MAHLKRGAGNLRHRLMIQRRIENPTSGAPDPYYEDVQEVWASIEPFGGREQFAGQQVQSTSNHVLRIRSVNWLTPAYRFSKWDEAREQHRRFNIDRIDDDPDGSRTYQECYCTEWWEAPNPLENSSA